MHLSMQVSKTALASEPEGKVGQQPGSSVKLARASPPGLRVFARRVELSATREGTLDRIRGPDMID
jgi:hypothetical protein